MMVRDRTACVTVAILDLIVETRGHELRQCIEGLLREEFWDERRKGVADRGDDNP
jgi:hypothetical protein